MIYLLILGDLNQHSHKSNVIWSLNDWKEKSYYITKSKPAKTRVFSSDEGSFSELGEWV